MVPEVEPVRTKAEETVLQAGSPEREKANAATSENEEI